MYPTYLAGRINGGKSMRMTLDRPNDLQAREHLFDALASVTDPTFQADEPEFDHLTDLFGQARVWSDIVRTRIAGLQTSKLGHPVVQAVQYPARDLLPISRDLSRELERVDLFG